MSNKKHIHSFLLQIRGTVKLHDLKLHACIARDFCLTRENVVYRTNGHTTPSLDLCTDDIAKYIMFKFLKCRNMLSS